MFLHTYHPNPILLNLGWLKIHWYGLIIALATVAGLGLLIWLNKKYKEKNIAIFKDEEQVFDLFFYLVLFGLFGARVYEVLLFYPHYISNPLDVFKIWQGGLAIHGVIIADILVIIWFAKKNKIDWKQLIDLVVPATALGQAIGRWGNYFNQELFGLPTNLPWGIPIDLVNRPVGFEQFSYFHPTFLYESILNLLLAGLLVRLCIYKVQNSKFKIQDLSVFLFYLVGYSVIRFFLEFIKIDETPSVLGLRWPQVFSLIVVLLVGVIYINKFKKGKK